MVNSLLESLANLEHEQWIHWSKDLRNALQTIAPELDFNLSRWEKLWVPYSELDEKEKDKDRKWAQKVLDLLQQVQDEDGKLICPACGWYPDRMGYMSFCRNPDCKISSFMLEEGVV